MLNNYATFIERYKVWVLVFSMLVIFLPLPNLSKLGLSNDMRVYFSEDSDHRLALDKLEDTFGQQENLLIYIEDKSGSVFNKKTLTALAQLTDTLWQTPYSARVDSITNFQRTSANDDELIINFLADAPVKLSDEDIRSIETYAINEPALRSRLISADGKATAINITFSLPEANPNSIEDIPTLASIKAKNFVDHHIDLLRTNNPQLTIETGGVIASNLAMGAALEADVSRLVPLSYLVLLIVLYMLVKSLASVALTLILVSLSIVHTFGIFSFFGHPITPTAGFVPTAIMAIAIADSVHFLTGYFHEIRSGSPHNLATINSLKNNARPIIITSITTIIGLLGLNFSDAQPYRDMGNMMAIGVCSALFLTLTFLPSILLCLSPLKDKGASPTLKVLEHLSIFVTNHPKRIVTFSLLILVFSGIGFTKNEISERWYQYFSDEFEVTRSLEKINNNLSGIHTIHYTLDTGKENGIYSPAFWKDVELFTDWFLSQEGVANTDSLLRVLKSINKSLNNDNYNYNRIPDTREEIAQYLFVYELSIPIGLGTEIYVNTKRSAIRLSVTLKKSNSATLISLDQEAKMWLSENALTIQPTHGTGMDLMFSRIAQDNALSLLYGTTVVLILVSIILIAALKSLPLGIISLIPNITPAIIAYGIWGYINGIIDLSSSVVICISLGIVVDDTVHFLSKYQHARDSLGFSNKKAVKYAFETVGNALIVTTLALISCFLTTIFSQFQPSGNLGMLLSLTLGVALLIDLLLLPSLLLLLDNNQKKTLANIE